jgi:hypothetical protein
VFRYLGSSLSLSLSLSLSKAYDYRPLGGDQENSFETQHQKLPFVAKLTWFTKQVCS